MSLKTTSLKRNQFNLLDMPKEKPKNGVFLSFRDMHKLADAGGRDYHNLLHVIMGQAKFSEANKENFKKWAGKILKRKL